MFWSVRGNQKTWRKLETNNMQESVGLRDVVKRKLESQSHKLAKLPGRFELVVVVSVILFQSYLAE